MSNAWYTPRWVDEEHYRKCETDMIEEGSDCTCAQIAQGRDDAAADRAYDEWKESDHGNVEL